MILPFVLAVLNSSKKVSLGAPPSLVSQGHSVSHLELNRLKPPIVIDLLALEVSSQISHLSKMENIPLKNLSVLLGLLQIKGVKRISPSFSSKVFFFGGVVTFFYSFHLFSSHKTSL